MNAKSRSLRMPGVPAGSSTFGMLYWASMSTRRATFSFVMFCVPETMMASVPESTISATAFGVMGLSGSSLVTCLHFFQSIMVYLLMELVLGTLHYIICPLSEKESTNDVARWNRSDYFRIFKIY